VTSGSITTALPVHRDLLVDFQTVTGTLSPPPGVTIGGIRFHLSVRGGAASPNNFTLDQVLHFGILIIDSNVDPGDVNPAIAADEHLDWMWWEGRRWNHSAGEFDNTQKIERQVKAMRRLDEVGQRLVWVAESAGSPANLNFGLSSSTLLLMP